MQKTVIFDFDGTIADSIPDNTYILKIFNQIATENNFRNITIKEVESLRDVGLLESIKLLKIPFYKIPFIARRVRKVIKVDETISSPIKDMPETLSQLKSNQFTLGIMTSNHKDTVEKFLISHKLNIFDFVYSKSNLFGKDKALKSLIKNQKLNTQSIIYVGDEIRDIQATKKIGMPIIAVTWGYNSKNGLLKYKPEYVAEKPGDLITILASNFAKTD